MEMKQRTEEQQGAAWHVCLKLLGWPECRWVHINFHISEVQAGSKYNISLDFDDTLNADIKEIEEKEFHKVSQILHELGG